MLNIALITSALLAVSPETKIDTAATVEPVSSAHAYSDSDLALDCTKSFSDLKLRMLAIDSIKKVTETDTQIAYMSDGISYTLTKNDHYAHPMIVRRDVVFDDDNKVDIKMAGCGYGSREDSDRLMQSFTNLNARYLLQQKVKVRSAEDDGFLILPAKK